MYNMYMYIHCTFIYDAHVHLHVYACTCTCTVCMYVRELKSAEDLNHRIMQLFMCIEHVYT